MPSNPGVSPVLPMIAGPNLGFMPKIGRYGVKSQYGVWAAHLNHGEQGGEY